jgi:hypothetical protein
MRNLLRFAVAFLCATACDDSGTDPALVVAEVRISPDLDTLFTTGESVTLSASAFNDLGGAIIGKTFTWSSSNVDVLRVTNAGLVTARGPNGSGIISATTDGVSSAASVVVATGPQGGTVTEFNGSVEVLFSPGAVSQPVAVTVEKLTSYPEASRVVAGTVFEFGPAGATFNERVVLIISYSSGSLPSGGPESDLRVHKLVEGAWIEVPGSLVNEIGNRVFGDIDGFSTYGVVLRATAESGVNFSPMR